MKEDFKIDIVVYGDPIPDIFTIDAVWMKPSIDPDGITLILKWGQKEGETEEEVASPHHLRGVRPRMKEIGPKHYVLLGEAMSREWWENLSK